MKTTKILVLMLTLVLSFAAIFSIAANAEEATVSASNIETTPYGDIDTATYPLDDANAVAVFEDNGDGTYTLLKTGALSVLKNYYHTTVKKSVNLVAYLRKDFTIPANGRIDPTLINGTLVVDLNGKAITRSSNSGGHMFDIKPTVASAAYTTDVVMKNGKLDSTGSYFIGINNSALIDGTDVTYTKNFNIDFENVTFMYSSTSATKTGVFFNCWENTASTADNSQMKINLNFDDKCVYDFTVAPSGATMFSITGNDKTQEADVVANFYGGTVKLANSAWCDVFAFTKAQDSVNLYPGSDGKMMKYETNVVTIMDTFKTTRSIAATNGTYYYVLDPISSTSQSFNYYLVTKNELPFEVLDASGKSVGKYAVWSEAFAKADDQSGSTIKLLKDAYQLTAGSASGNFGTITIDLNNHTLTKVGSAYLINTYFANTKEQSTKIIIKNGTMVKNSTANSFGFFCINYSNVEEKNTAVATIDFEINNVNFESKKTDGFIFSLFENGYDKDWTKGTNTTAVFTDCTFKYKNTVFMLENNSGNATKSVINLQINGGQFIADTTSTVAKLYEMDASDTVTFGKGTDGKYPIFTVPNGVELPASEAGWFTADGVECVPVSVSENGENVNYTLYPVVMVGYKIKTSVTLWSNFVYNVYIPVTNFNSVKLNGLAVAYEEVEIDGVAYYRVAVNLAAGEALADFKLTVTLNTGDTTVDANWTLDVFKYTKAVLAGEYNDTTKALMKDMLVYASAAHTYFENTASVSDKLAEIATLLNGYSAALPTGEAKKPASSTYFTDVAVNVGEVPSFRFYLADGYTADNFTFKVGKRNAAATVGTDENGDYLEITMYAYMMLDDITYTVVGADVSESYNLYSYHAYATAIGDANLVAVVEALMNYSVSAKAYRDAVIGN